MISGDLFDGDLTADEEFVDDVKRYMQIFELPQHIKMYVVAGNHDIGFHPE